MDVRVLFLFASLVATCHSLSFKHIGEKVAEPLPNWDNIQDGAGLRFSTGSHLVFSNLLVEYVSELCYQCLYQPLISVAGKNVSDYVVVDTTHPMTLRFKKPAVSPDFLCFCLLILYNNYYCYYYFFNIMQNASTLHCC
jgi:hypothetical protein